MLLVMSYKDAPLERRHLAANDVGLAVSPRLFEIGCCDAAAGGGSDAGSQGELTAPVGSLGLAASLSFPGPHHRSGSFLGQNAVSRRH
jgi:hypothetical protein